MKNPLLTAILTLAAFTWGCADDPVPFESVKLTTAPAINWELRNNETVDAQKIGGPLSIKLESCKGIVITACDLNSIELIDCEDITIRNCWIHDSERIAVQAGACRNLIVEGCRMENVVSGVYAVGGHGIRVLGNFARNMKGPFPRGQAAQFDAVTGTNNAISNNYVINERGKSMPEDCINLYQSAGTAESPILVENNYLTGDPVAGSLDKSPNGSGIMMGDQGGAHILCRKNTILSAGQMGIGVAGGHFIRVEDNYILGLKSNVTSQGMYVWNQSKQPCDHITLARNRVHWVNKEGEEFSFWNGGGATDLTETDNHFSDATLLSEAQPQPPSQAPLPPKPWISVSTDGSKKARVGWQAP